MRDQGNCLIFKVANEAYLGFCQHKTIPSHKGIIITLLIDEVDAVYQHVSSLGIKTEAEPKTNETFQIHHFFALDPDGYRVEIQRFFRAS